jgi:predicted anti-sigma-YlaC factor YlaD
LSAPGGPLPAELEQHLAGCLECRGEVERLAEQSRWVRCLRGTEEVRPGPGFYAGVLERIESQQGASLWSVFLEPAFGRRLVLATLVLTVTLGSLVAFQVADDAFGSPPPEAIMAIEDHPLDWGADPERDRQTMLVDLASYQE